MTIRKQMIPIIRDTNTQPKDLFRYLFIICPEKFCTGFAGEIKEASLKVTRIATGINRHGGSMGMRVNYKRYGLYLIRWQASTPILAGVGIILVSMGQLVAAIVANLIGGLIFFWVDQFIFTSQSLAAQWEVKENIICVDCGRIARGYRLVRSGEYDRTLDHEPEFRCEDCSRKKSEKLKELGVKTE